MNKNKVVDLLETIADLMEFLNENPFKIKAYRNGAEALRKTEISAEDLLDKSKLNSIKGVGKGLQGVITEYLEDGESNLLKELKEKVPDGIEELLNIRGLGAKKIYMLYTELGIKTIANLEEAATNNTLLKVKGFNEKTKNKVLTEIDRYKKDASKVLLKKAVEYQKIVEEKLSNIKSIKKFVLTGELSRNCEVISQIDFVVFGEFNKIYKEACGYLSCIKNDNQIIIKDFLVDIYLYVVDKENDFQIAQLITTGSIEFLNKLNLDIKFSSQEEFFTKNKLPFIIPEMRELQYFETKKREIQENSDLDFRGYKGLLHFHTNYSDGRNSLTEMIEEAKELNIEYAVVCDHSKSAFYAGGLKEDKILNQKNEVQNLAKELNFKVLQGIESDILANGNLDYADDILSQFSFVVASIHSITSMSEDEMTQRLIRAIENPYTNLIGHPSGRILLSRGPYKLNVKKIIDACAANNTAIEINAHPNRLDLDWRYLFYAREKGCYFSINPDAHTTSEIHYIDYGLRVSRKGGLLKREVINYYDFETFKNFCNLKYERIK